MESQLAPMGELLDNLLLRLAQVEKVANNNNMGLSTSPTTVVLEPNINTGTDDDKYATQIQSLQAEVADLKKQLQASTKKCSRLEQQLINAGVKVVEDDIEYSVAKSKVKEIALRMQEIGDANASVANDKEKQKQLQAEYFKLELEMEKYNNALLTSQEYIQEGKNAEAQWESDIKDDNRVALESIRRCMPVDIKNLSEAQLVEEKTPNGKVLPKSIAKKFKRCNILQLLRLDPNAILRSHPASLENYRVSGMSLTERRAVYSHLTDSITDSGLTIAKSWEKNRKDPMVDRKLVWYNTMRDNLKSALSSYNAHVEQCGGSFENHECEMIGNQCPVRADRSVINYYEEDYGYPEGDVYIVTEKAASISLSAAPENMADPSQLSEDRVKEEKKNVRKLAYLDWKKAFEKEQKEHTEKRAEMQVKIEDLERRIEDLKVEETEYAEEHTKLKQELSSLPRGSPDRLPTMKKVNVCQTQRANAKRRSEEAMKELEKLKMNFEQGKEFVCSVSKPTWDENGDDTDDDDDDDAQMPSSGNREIEFRRLSLRNIHAEVDSKRRYSTSVIPSKQPTKPAGLLAAIQNIGGLKEVDEDIAKPTNSNATVKESNSNESSHAPSTKQERHADDEMEVSVVKLPPDTKDNVSQQTQYNRKSSREQQPQTYIRKRSGTVEKTLLVSCPPPKEGETHLRHVAIDAEKAKQKAEKDKQLALEKAREAAKERSEQLQADKEKRLARESAEREEAAIQERGKQELIAKQRQEEEQKRKLAKEAERKKKLEEEQRKKDEEERVLSDKKATLEARVQECENDLKESEDMMLQCKKELKELPRGSKDKLSKMKEINKYQQKKGEVKRALDVAKEELRLLSC